MGWVTEDGGHEGWVPAIWPDGRVSVGSTGGAAMVQPVGPDGRPAYDDAEEIRDGRTAIGWRGFCECGWRGQMWERVTDAAGHDFAARRIYDGDPVLVDGRVVDVQRWGDAPGEVEEAVYREWEAHVRPLEALDVVRDAASASAAAQGRLTDAVRAARAEGNSWTEIGKAAGMTRQSAHERWARHIAAAQEHAAPREIYVDPATITRLDAREEQDPNTGRVGQRATVGTTPDGTPVVLYEVPPPIDYPTGDGWPKLAETPGHRVWAYDSIEAAREDRDYQIARGYRPEDIPTHIRDVSG